MKNKKTRLCIIIICILAILAAAGITVSTFMQGGSGKLAFLDTMIKETIVNEVCDIEEFVENPQGKVLKLTAAYTDKSGVEKNYITAGLTFKPTQIGEARITVEATDGEKIETTIEVIEAAPTVVTTEEAEYEWKTTIKLEELKEHVVYKSVSEPEFRVLSAEYMDQKFELEDETEFTFEQVGTYIFSFEISNRGGTVTGQMNVNSKRVLTANEENDLTNNSSIFIDSHAQLTMSEEHAENSDWAWEIKAFASDTYNDPNGGYFKNQIKIDFGREIDASQYYFTMDIKPSKDSMGVAIHYLTAENKQSSPMGFHDGLGEWNHISSQDMITEGTYTGVLIVLIHPQEEGSYDPENVTCLIDNMYLHQYPDPNAPIIVGGVEDYDITTSKVSWVSSGSLGNYQIPFVEFNKDYTNQTMTFTTKVDTSKSPALIIGARMDGAATNYGENSGLMVGFYDGFIEIYAPKFGTWLKAEVLKLENNKEYTFAYSVETVDGQDTFYLKITDTSGNEIMNYSLPLAAGTVNAKGSFVIWNPAENVSISYSEPQTVARKQNVNVVVPADGKAGVAGLATNVAGSLTSAAYLAMDGNYTTETFTFTTKIADGKNPNLLIGTHMKGIDTLVSTYEGVTVQFYYNKEANAGFYEVYAPLHGKWIGAESLTLESGKEYTFNVSMKDNKFNMIVEQGGKTIHDRTFEVKVEVPTSGKFMVWTLNESQEIFYEMPVNKVKAENKNVVVENASAAGSAELTTVVPNSATSASYLALKGDYTDETFTFTTTITDAEKPNLIIGARMAGVDALPNTYEGITMQFYKGFYEVYGVKHGTMLYEGSAAACTLETGKEYTFNVEVSGDKFTLSVVNEGNVIHKQSFTIPSDKSIPESGSFMVWNMDAARTISYEKPEVVIPEPTKVTITELRSDYTIKTDGTGITGLYLVTDVKGSSSTWKFHRAEDVMLYNESAVPSDTCWAGSNVLYVQTYFNYEEYGKFVIPAGYQFTVEGDDTVYEIAEEATWYYYDGALQTEEPVIPDEPTKVTITELRSDYTLKADGSAANGMYLITDVEGSSSRWKFHRAEDVMLYNASGVPSDTCWAEKNVLYVQTYFEFEEYGEFVIPAGYQFTVEGDDTVYEIAEEVKWYYYDGALQTEEPVIPVEPTKVTITELRSDYTLKVNGSAANGMYLITDVAGSSSTWKFHRAEDVMLYNASGVPSDTCWAGSNVLYVQTYFTFEEYGEFVIPAGYQFTVEGDDTVYEIAEEVKWYYYDGALQTEEPVIPEQTTKVTITELRSDYTLKVNGSAANGMYLITDIKGSSSTWKFHRAEDVMLYNESGVPSDTCWAGSNVLYVQTYFLFDENGEFVIPAGYQFTVEGDDTVYEIAEDVKLYYYDGALQTEEPDLPVEPTLVTITGAGASDATYKTINLVTDIAGPGAIWKYDNETRTKYNAADATYPLGWVANNVLQLITSGKEWASGDTIILLKGMQFTVEGVVYELAEGYKLTYDGSSWQGTTISPTYVTITGVGASDATYKTINLATDIVGPGAIWKYDDTMLLKYNWIYSRFPMGWVATNVLQIITSGQTWATNDIIVLEAGTQFLVKDTEIVYEIVEDFKLRYNGSSWIGEQ